MTFILKNKNKIKNYLVCKIFHIPTIVVSDREPEKMFHVIFTRTEVDS